MKFGKLSAHLLMTKIVDPMGRVSPSELLEAVLAIATSSFSLGVCLPDRPVPIVDFAMNEFTHVRADEGLSPEEANPVPRCAGDPPTEGHS